MASVRLGVWGSFGVLAAVWGGSGCGVALKPLALEDARKAHLVDTREVPVRTMVVYGDATTDVWGLEKSPCKYLREVRDPVAQGQSALQLEWDASSCAWTGMGIGWNAWLPKDLMPYMGRGELRFRIRSVEGESRVPLIILLLEDYSGKMASAVFGTHCLERYPLDSAWQEVSIPIDAFDFAGQTCDATNIKQLVLELQGSGAVLIDAMEIGPLRPRPEPDRSAFPESRQALARGVTDVWLPGHAGMWGLGTTTCRSYLAGPDGIAMQWDARSDCGDGRQLRCGVTWSDWRAVDLNAAPSATLELRFSTSSATLPPGLQVALEGWNGARAARSVADHARPDSGAPGHFTVALTPRDFDFAAAGVDPTRIRELTLEAVAGTVGNVTLQSIRWIHEN